MGHGLIEVQAKDTAVGRHRSTHHRRLQAIGTKTQRHARVRLGDLASDSGAQRARVHNWLQHNRIPGKLRARRCRAAKPGLTPEPGEGYSGTPGLRQHGEES